MQPSGSTAAHLLHPLWTELSDLPFSFCYILLSLTIYTHAKWNRGSLAMYMMKYDIVIETPGWPHNNNP